MGFFGKTRGKAAAAAVRTDAAKPQEPFYTFIDVETPNRRNDRICSIGIVVSDENGNVLERRSQLTNPESTFDEVNMRITGISPIDVKAMPPFPEVWESVVAPLLNPRAIVAHNASFDLNVIAKTLTAYGMPIPDIEYACTMEMARVAPSIESLKLPEVCNALGVSMGRHHDALEDAEACAEVFWSMKNALGISPNFRQYQYHESESRSNLLKARTFSDKTIALRTIMAAMDEFASDGRISFDEASAMLSYMMSDQNIADDPSLSTAFSMLQESVMDGFIDGAESERIIAEISRIIDPGASSECQSVVFPGKRFVLTGTFEHGTKESVEGYIEANGGEMIKNVTKKCDYVVIGGCGSEAYSLGNYGTKVKKAMEWQAKGVPIEIITEDALYAQEDSTSA